MHAPFCMLYVQFLWSCGKMRSAQLDAVILDDLGLDSLLDFFESLNADLG